MEGSIAENYATAATARETETLILSKLFAHDRQRGAMAPRTLQSSLRI
jgi:hypothetical protein